MPVDTHSFALSNILQVGDVVFIRVHARAFREVSIATGSWTNHVGIVVAKNGNDISVAESTFPLSRTTSFESFVARSEQGKIAITRLQTPLTSAQQRSLVDAARRRCGIFYDTGFNLHSKGQFCSRFVREVLAEATGENVGDVESFADLLARRPSAALGFWRLWYFGRIPWTRETVTPASLLCCHKMKLVFEGSLRPKHDASKEWA
ncbi:YebB family permuted papain-like enzyme [Ralstonia chuxiongensis]|uniref:YebB family permuted papain-like enzyme n=1 Tax=Ralstonia chuxiongensis TaxID=2957504 RepID=UPI0028F61CC7|nr:YebB family permuted papain-like enzyme [Ralstonia chuxiongensis]CAJ0785194.1 hypothetical protein R8510_05357 [Ralstonia chuxiongensis]